MSSIAKSISWKKLKDLVASRRFFAQNVGVEANEKMWFSCCIKSRRMFKKKVYGNRREIGENFLKKKISSSRRIARPQKFEAREKKIDIKRCI